jgi:hypothetical protein
LPAVPAFFQLNYPQANQPKNKPLANKPSNNSFHIHKVALRPLLHTLDHKQTIALFDQLESVDQNEFVTFLYHQGLAQMWLPFLLQQDTLPASFEETVKALKQDALHTAATQLMQRKILRDTRDAFKQASIDYLVFKGAHLRHTIYADPTHRSVCDIDILVRDGRKFDAVDVLQKAGFGAVHKAENISHETSLHKNNVWIDLHWHLMRPGRTRINLNDYLFEQRQAFGEFEGLSNEASLLVMLIHPAITKYVNGSASSLRHLVDIHRLAQCDGINWERLTDMLNKSGTRTAAWASLTWLQMLTDEPMYEDLTKKLKPGGLKARWLHHWMRKDLNTKLAEKKMIIRAGFSLLLKYNWMDVANAVSTLKEEKQKTEETLKMLEKQGLEPR